MPHNPDVTEVPEHIQAQVHALTAEGEPVERIAFLTRLSVETVEAELRNPTVAPTVYTTDDEAS